MALAFPGFPWQIPEEADPERRREVRILFGVTRPQIVVYLVAWPFFFIPGVTGLQAAVASAVVLLLGAAIFLAALALAHRGRVELGSWFVIVSSLVTQMAATSMFGGIRGVLAASLVLSIIVAGILRGIRAAGITGAILAGFVGVLWLLESRGLAPFVLPALTPAAAVVSIVAIVATAVALLALYARELQLAAAETRASAAQALAAEQRLADLAREAPDGIAVLDAEGRVVEANAALLAISGLAAAEVIGKQLLELPGISSGAARRTLEEGFARNLREGVGGVQVELVRPDGQPFVIETRGRVVSRPGAPVRVHFVIRDVTARVLAERERARLEEDLRDARRMESIGRLAGGVAHDFRNLLTPMLANASLLAADAPLPPEEVRALARDIEDAAQKASALTGQLLAVARRQMVDVKNLDVGVVLRGIEPFLRRLVREDVRLHWELARGLGGVRADRSQLEQVIVNLVANARDAMPGGGDLTVAASTTDLGAAEAAEHPGARPGPHVVLAVSDTGVGMTEEVRARAFDPFFTTKEAGGTGLGLATVQGIAAQLGGHVRLETAPGKGSTFRVYLPVAEGPVEAPSAPPPGPQPLPTGATALVVDDAPGPRAAIARILRGAGLEVLEAKDGEEALAAIRKAGRPLDLVVSDVVMPGMDGPALVERLRESQPGIRALLVSGYADQARVDASRLPAGVLFLAKPFTPEALIAKVAEALRSPGRDAA